jgi:glycosyltransferase involved in cell wall biosynthesis
LLKFTVVIPTRDRPDTFGQTLKNVLLQDYPDFQVLIADNSSGSETFDISKDENDYRIKYIKTGPGLAMSANWERALLEIDGGWVTILGDDDALLPESLHLVNQLSQEYSVKAIRSNGASFAWPGNQSHPYGHLRVVINRKPEVLNSLSALKEVLEGNRVYDTLPMLYNGGFIDSSLIKEAKHRSPSFYHSSIPDLYSAFAFSFLTDKYLLYNRPLAINGASRHSGGTAFFQYDETSSQYGPAKMFTLENNLPNHQAIPLTKTKRQLRSLHSLVLESFLQARDVLRPEFPTPDYFAQLKLIVADSKDKNEILDDWILQFASIHSLKDDIQSFHPTTVLFGNKLLNRFGPSRFFSIAKRIMTQPKMFEMAGTSEQSINLDDASQIIKYIVDRYE